jgi:hypothetical protein
MSFFIRIWTQGSEIPFINSRVHQISSDMVDISPATVIDAEVEGSYMDAGEVRQALSISGQTINISGRNVLWQSVSTR